MDMLHLARSVGLQPEPHVWQIQKALVDFVASHWREPDEGIWEIRGPRRHFTHSKVMAWVAVDRAVKAVERFGLKGPVDEWRRLRDEIHAQVCTSGFDAQRGCFVQHYGSTDLDASLLLMPLVGFLPPDDPRVRATIDAIRRELVVDGLVMRYPTVHGVDGAAARRRHLPAVHVLARRQPRDHRPRCRGGARCSSGWSARATTSACSPRSTTRARAA